MATKRKKSKSARGKKDVFVADFSKMEEGEGGGARYPEGDYIGTIVKATRDVSSEKGTPHIKVVLKIDEPEKYAGKKITERLWSTPKSLSRIYDLLEILGIKVPKREVAIPLKKLLKKQVGFTLVDEEYEGKKRSRVAWDWLDPEDVFTDDEEDEDEDDLEDEDDEDEEDEDEDEDEDEEDLEEMDRAELKAYIKENGLDVKVKKSMDEDDIREAIEEAEGDDDDEDEDEDEDDLEELDLDEL